MPAEVDTWVCDRFGDGLLVWQSPPGASLAGELAVVVRKVRELVGKDATPTIYFDRGGWPPKLFAKHQEANFHVLTVVPGGIRWRSVPRTWRGAADRAGGRGLASTGDHRDGGIEACDFLWATGDDRGPKTPGEQCHAGVDDVGCLAHAPLDLPINAN